MGFVLVVLVVHYMCNVCHYLVAMFLLLSAWLVDGMVTVRAYHILLLLCCVTNSVSVDLLASAHTVVSMTVSSNSPDCETFELGT